MNIFPLFLQNFLERLSENNKEVLHMIRKWTAALAMALLLSGCGSLSGPAEEQIDQMPTAEELGLPATMDLEFVAEEQVQTTPATLYVGEGYSLYVPDAGWRKETDREGRIPVDGWESALDEKVEVAVFRYGAVPLEEAVSDFLEEHDDYVFQQLLMGSGEVSEPLEGMDEDGTILKFVIRAGKEGNFIVSWKYRDALGSAASQAEQMVRTFVTT